MPTTPNASHAKLSKGGLCSALRFLKNNDADSPDTIADSSTFFPLARLKHLLSTRKAHAKYDECNRPQYTLSKRRCASVLDHLQMFEDNDMVHWEGCNALYLHHLMNLNIGFALECSVAVLFVVIDGSRASINKI